MFLIFYSDFDKPDVAIFPTFFELIAVPWNESILFPKEYYNGDYTETEKRNYYSI